MNLTVVEPDLRRWDPGEAIGRYTLLARIAIGGMAEIWLARQMGLRGFEKVVVIKRISDTYSADPQFVEMFLDEARIAAQLDHPNIVQIHDLGEHRGAYYIAMEYLHGEDLAMVVRSGAKSGKPLPLTHAAKVISNAAEGLASAHAKTGLDGKPLGVVHRDVSPQNIFVTYEGVVKVLDFGVAKAANRASSTMGGQLKGKFGYMAPEQARGDDVDKRSDVWSLGVVLFEAVTLTRLWEPKQEQLKMIRELSSDEPVPLARSRNPSVPADLEAIIAKALHRNPAHRYQSALELKAALDKWLRSVPEAMQTIDLGAYMRQAFGERMGRKSALIESARSGEIKFFKVPEALKPATENSMPGDTVLVSGANQPAMKPRAPIGLMAALGACGALLLMTGIWLSGALSAPAALEVTSDPPGAHLEVDGVDQGLTPVALVNVKPGKHVLVASLAGRSDQAKTVTLSSGEHLSIELKLAEPAPPAAAPEPSPPPPAKPVAAVAAPVVVAAPPPSEAPRAVSRGRLSIDTRPWTSVLLNGRKLGDTPLIEVPIASGTHKLKLVNDEKGLSKSIEVTIQSGKTTVLKLDLKK